RLDGEDVGAVAQRAAVAQQQVVARAAVDDVAAGAAEDDVVAAAHRDGVVAAQRRVAGADLADLPGRIVEDGAVVAEHDVEAVAGRDGVAADARDDGTGAVARLDDVPAARGV